MKNLEQSFQELAVNLTISSPQKNEVELETIKLVLDNQTECRVVLPVSSDSSTVVFVS